MIYLNDNENRLWRLSGGLQVSSGVAIANIPVKSCPSGVLQSKVTVYGPVFDKDGNDLILKPIKYSTALSTAALMRSSCEDKKSEKTEAATTKEVISNSLEANTSEQENGTSKNEVAPSTKRRGRPRKKPTKTDESES